VTDATILTAVIVGVIVWLIASQNDDATRK
jgi:hypothetical protein